MELYSIIWDSMEINEIEIFINYDLALKKLEYYEKIKPEFKLWSYRLIKLNNKSNIYSFN